MSTEIKIWEITESKVRLLEETSLAAERLEEDLESWIADRPEILGGDLLIVARQKTIEGVGRLDLLCVNVSGQLTVVELKRDLSSREAVAQALDYASWLDKLSESEILGIAEEYLERPLEEAMAEKYGLREMPAITGSNHRILIVCSRLDSSAERIINYLAQRYSVNVNAQFFRYAKLPTGQELLVRSELVAESVIQARASDRKRSTPSELTSISVARQILPIVEAFRALAESDEDFSEEAATTYGGSFRFWRRNSEGKPKMVFGVNVAGDRRQCPLGSLDIWIPTRTLGQVLGVGDQKVQDLIRSLPASEMRGGDCLVRLSDATTAKSIASRLRDWFRAIPQAVSA